MREGHGILVPQRALKFVGWPARKLGILGHLDYFVPSWQAPCKMMKLDTWVAGGDINNKQVWGDGFLGQSP